MQSPFLRLCGSRYTFVQTCLGDGVPTDKTAFTECFYVYIRNISYYKNALIILSFGLFIKFADYSNSYANEADKSTENSACGTR